MPAVAFELWEDGAEGPYQVATLEELRRENPEELEVLAEVAALEPGQELAIGGGAAPLLFVRAVAACRVCGCSEHRPCQLPGLVLALELAEPYEPVPQEAMVCRWLLPELCSRCAVAPVLAVR